jgi:2-amino-4-hydroxy-6-hydroxymethyldihydropteridine diphosphokinase
MDVYLGLGTNEGDKLKNLWNAANALSIRCGEIINESSIYESPSWGFETEEKFYNSVVLIQTDLSPEELLFSCQQIERDLGRRKKTQIGYESRVIDIDILLYEKVIFDSEDLKIPHPLIDDRMFVLKPLFELLEMTGSELISLYETKIANCNDQSKLRVVQS